MSRQIQIGEYATVEIRPGILRDQERRLVIVDDRGSEVTLTLKTARELYGALRTFDSEGLLE